jgi:hypothetical protein
MKAILPRTMSKAEMKALDGSIRKQIAENVSKLECYIEATVLWHLHVKYGKGAKWLSNFLDDFSPALQELKAFYEVDGQEDTEFACIHNLRSIGFDTDKLGKALTVDYTINGRK